jgi:hypothetical protein
MGNTNHNLVSLRKGLFLASLFVLLFSSSSVRAEGPVLSGLAEITAATSAIVAPALLIGSQVNVAQTRANGAKAVSTINAQATMANAALQAQTAMANGMMMMQTAVLGQQAQTRDLLAQLQYLAYNRAIDNQLAREKMYHQLQMQQNLLALEFKKAELTRLLNESNRLAGISGVPSIAPNKSNLQSGLSSNQNPMAAALGSTVLNSSDNFSSGVTSSLGLKKALNASLGSGSTRKQVRSDLSVFNSESTSGRYLAAQPEGIYRRSASRTGLQSTRRNSLTRGQAHK